MFKTIRSATTLLISFIADAGLPEQASVLAGLAADIGKAGMSRP